MIVSKKVLSYINDYFLNITDEDFISVCNNAGIEVEQIIKHKLPSGLIIVKINNFYKHPNSDKLNIVNIQIDSTKTMDIVCGAPNLQVGKYAIYAPVGSKLWNGLELTEKEIRGVVSKGMLCGYNEITNCSLDLLSTSDAQGIVLIDYAKVGDKNINEYLMLDDVIYDVSIPSNRNDLNSHLLFANELLIAAKKPSIVDRESFRSNHEINDFKSVNKEICNDFSLIKLPNFDFKPTWKEKEILMACGYKVQNNLLDLMNLFTIYYGNPMHVYNADELDINKIKVDLNNQETKFLSLDGNEYNIPKNSICIYHNDEIINIAGIIGNDKHKYVETASNIIIEIANFNPNYIRSTIDKLKLSTKSQATFIKPLSSWITQKTFYELINSLEQNGLSLNCYTNFSIISPLDIVFDYDELYKFLGIKNPISFSTELERGIYHAHPSRLDISNQYDVFEEVLKTIDVNELEPEPILFSVPEEQTNNKFNNINKIKTFLCNNGLLETKTYNLTNEESYSKFNFFNLSYKAQLIDPISKARAVFRLSAIDEMLKVIQYNNARKREMQNIFEITNLPLNEKISKEVLSMVFTKNPYLDIISGDKISNNFSYIKNLVNNLFKTLNHDAKFEVIENELAPEVASCKIAIKLRNVIIGYISQVKSSILKKYDLPFDVFVVAIDLTLIDDEIKVRPINKVSMFPTVFRDINIVNRSADEINKLLLNINKIKNIKSTSLINIFEKENDKIYTIRIEISSIECTLSTEEIDSIMLEVQKIIK